MNENNIFWGISYDAWFTGLTPILIFILGYIVNEIIKKINEKKRLKDLEKYFRQLIQLLNKPLNKQIKNFLKFSHSLKEKKEQLLVLDDVTNFHVEQIREISNQDLYTIYIKNKNGGISLRTELYGKLRANIDFIDQVKKSIRDYFPMFWGKYDKYQQDYKINIDTISNWFQNMISENINSFGGQQDAFLKEFDNIISKWQSSKNIGIGLTDMYVTKVKFIEPLRDLCRKYFSDPRSMIISKYIMQCVYAFNDIEETKRVFRRLYLLQAKKLQNSWFEINEILNQFDSLKPRK